MLKTIFTLFRGQSTDAAEKFIDANALSLLRQQIRDASVAVKRSRQAVAIAMAGQEQETARYGRIKEQIADLETRAMAAIEAGKDDMAREAAEAIAGLEDEKAASKKAQALYNTEIVRLKSDIRSAQLKLRDLERGQRLATATDRTQKLADMSPVCTMSNLREAEETLNRLNLSQQATDLARKAEAELEMATAPSEVVERMAAEGLGEPLRSSADAVLERLKTKGRKKPSKTTA